MKNFFKFLFDYIKSLFFILFLIGLFVGGIVFIIFVFNGKIYIEILILFILIYLFLFWGLWYRRSKKKLLKDYSHEKDKTKKQETGREFIRGTSGIEGRIEEREPAVTTSASSDVRPEQPSRRELLSSAKVDDGRKKSPGIGKTSKGSRGIFARRKRRRK